MIPLTKPVTWYREFCDIVGDFRNYVYGKNHPFPSKFSTALDFLWDLLLRIDISYQQLWDLTPEQIKLINPTSNKTKAKEDLQEMLELTQYHIRRLDPRVVALFNTNNTIEILD